MAERYIEIDCLEVRQPIGVFYVGVMEAEDLVRVSYADIRRMGNDLDDYLGIQRRLSPSRVEELKKYTATVDATFPTGVILAMSSDHATYDKKSGKLKILDADEVAKIIDGQHRIKGLEDYRGGSFQINVSIFIDMDIEDQAMVFATINLAQTKVNKSLVYDLYEYTQHRSPHKTAHNIARLLNSRDESPLKNRIKILGTAAPGLRGLQTITQATFVESMIKMISGTTKRAFDDREAIKKGQKIEKATPEESRSLVFRDMFVSRRDAEIASVVWNYFDAISQRWSDAWNDLKRPGNILPRTNGFRAFMRFLPDAYTKLGGPPDVPATVDFHRKIFRNVPLTDTDFVIENYAPGTSGETALLTDLQKSLASR